MAGAKAGPSLLARIRHPETTGGRRQATEEDTRRSVLEHLRAMCTTRHGTMVTQPDYGVADVSEMIHAFPDAIAEMARSIRHTIQMYEPRLMNVRVKHIPSEDMTLRYELTAQLVTGSSKVPVAFETTIDPSRRIVVR
jgi:type VI secretion system protein